MTQVRMVYRLFLGVSAMVILTIMFTVFVYERVRHDEYTTCVVQARGLPAGHHLAAAEGDIGDLLALAFKAETPAQKANTPPKDLALLEDLKTQTLDYAKIEANQPKSRTC